MKRIKTLGLLITVALALTATGGAATASASGFGAHNYTWPEHEYPADVSASTTEPFLIYLGNGNSLQCSGPSSLHATLPGTSRQLSASFTDESECKVTISGVTLWKSKAINSHGCRLIFHSGAETYSGTFDGTYDIGGPECSGGMQVSATDIKCTLTFPPQSGQPAAFHNFSEGNKSGVEIEQLANATLEYTSEGAGEISGCPKNGLHTNAGWFSEYEATARNEAGTQVGFAVDANAPLGVYLEGGEFKGESYPLSVAGDQDEAIEFAARWGEEVTSRTSCASAHFATTLKAASTSLSPTTSYGGCSTNLFGEIHSATIAMNSCHYVLQAGGTIDISCSKEGDAITITSALGCVLTIGAQTGLEGVTYSTIGSGHERAIEANLGVSGVSFSANKGLLYCGVSKGSHTDGSYSGSVVLYGGEE